ncbi:glycerol dehydrogenase [Kipferlia bialata]|uniref:Glycerol dehydrogenase n=1 Tax=Kipferlia bialata TaxID=797122 RepID=A0A9K3CQB2_9EUKA|nr:glycerol dehydrogenase [Kipferlia bialata]|eukprot:g1172.t1
MSQAAITGAPSRYIQGAGCVREAGIHIAKLGNNAFCLGGKRGTASVHDALVASCGEANVHLTFELFAGECCLSEVSRLQTLATAAGATVIVGVGGGKSMDTAKVLANLMELPVVIIPTIASSDAPCTALSVIYTDTGDLAKYEFFPASPNLVLVDTQVICKTPTRFLVAGMGDALATYYEAEACCTSRSKNCHSGMSSLAARCLAKLCRDTLFEYGVAAKHLSDANTTGPALDHVVEANTLLSGVGAESSGVAAAHDIQNGLAVCPESHDYYHGEKVAFGVCAQLLMQDSPQEVIQQEVVAQAVMAADTLGEAYLKSIQ